MPDLLPTAEALTAQLEDEVRARIAEIDLTIAGVDHQNDTPRFLRGVRNCNLATIRPAPTAAQRALAKTKNPDISIAQLVQVIEEDPTLGQALLRYANSAYYATGGGPIVSLKAAAQRVGTSGIHNVVLSTMVDGMLCRPGALFQPMVDLVRSHMIRTAPIARAIARAFAVPADEAFALALLHDAGKLIIFDVLGDLRHELRRDPVIQPAIVCQTLMYLHEPLGGLAALRWGLDVSTALAIASHHRTPVPKTENRMSEVLYIAEHADHAMQGVITTAIEAWWAAGQIPGTPMAARELLDAYMATESAGV